MSETFPGYGDVPGRVNHMSPGEGRVTHRLVSRPWSESPFFVGPTQPNHVFTDKSLDQDSHQHPTPSPACLLTFLTPTRPAPKLGLCSIP